MMGGRTMGMETELGGMEAWTSHRRVGKKQNPRQSDYPGAQTYIQHRPIHGIIPI